MPSQTQRQLAAIMFTDMVGYTALMQENEMAARIKRERYRQILEERVQAFEGNILQYYGDGSMIIFKSAMSAVNCGVEIQQHLVTDPKVDLRIGIHMGDVAIEETGVFGDGVNVASRIESLAVPGSVFISEKVFDEVRNHEEIKTQPIGYFELKNVKQPMQVFAITNSGLVIPSRDVLRGKTQQPTNRLAVLPFVNMSGDADNEYFSDGITEELINALTRVEGLQVTSRTSSFAFKNKSEDVRDVALKLNVDKILEGSVRKSGNRVRITAQLVNAADGYHIWSEKYDRNLNDIFEVQDEISGVIANRLREKLTLAEKNERLVEAPTANLEAYDAFLKGMFFVNKSTPENFRKAIEYFEEATGLEPSFAKPYAAIAITYTWLAGTGQMNAAAVLQIVEDYSHKALQLNPDDPEACVAMGTKCLFFDSNWNDAKTFLEKAYRLSTAAHTMDILAFYYGVMNNMPKAVEVIEKAARLDPLSVRLLFVQSNVYLAAGRIDDVEKLCLKILELNPASREAIEQLGWVNYHKGNYEKALEYFSEFHERVGDPEKAIAPLALIYGAMGETEKAKELISRLEKRMERENLPLDFDLVMAWVGLDNAEKILFHLREALRKKQSVALFSMRKPFLRKYHHHPEYVAILHELGLPEVST